MRKQIRRGDADQRGGARQLAFGLGDVGTAAQEIDRQSGANASGQRRKNSRLRQLLAEIFGKFSDQNGNHITRRIDLGDERRDLRLQLRQFALAPKSRPARW